MNELAPEFSRIIQPEKLSPTGREEVLEPKPTERLALAKRFDLIELQRLVATLSLKPELRGAVAVKGRVEADVVQRCVVTLEPLSSHLDMAINMIFVPESLQRGGAGSPDIENSDEDVEYYAHNKIDLGELIAQHLGINLDPYPRKPDAALEQTEFGQPDQNPHPLAQLAVLTKKTNKDDKTSD